MLNENSAPLRGVFRAPAPVFAGNVLDRHGRLGSHQAWLQVAAAGQLHALGLSLPDFSLPPLESPVAEAQVHQNAWVAACPFCAGQEGIWGPEDVFFCCSCGNQQVGGRLLTIHYAIAPGSVSAELARRPDPRNRGWLPTETLADLEAETEGHLPNKTVRPDRPVAIVRNM